MPPSATTSAISAACAGVTEGANETGAVVPGRWHSAQCFCKEEPLACVGDRLRRWGCFSFRNRATIYCRFGSFASFSPDSADRFGQIATRWSGVCRPNGTDRRCGPDSECADRRRGLPRSRSVHAQSRALPSKSSHWEFTRAAQPGWPRRRSNHLRLRSSRETAPICREAPCRAP